MPLNLTSPKTINVNVDTVNITAFAVDLDRAAIHITYSEGYVDTTGTFVAVGEKTFSIYGEDMQNSIARANGYAADMGTVDIYKAIKLALYDDVKAYAGVDGAVV